MSKHKDKVKFMSGAAENFRLDEQVDCIYMSGTMHHFTAPKQAIKNCKTWLSGQGIIIICEPIITNPYAWYRVIFKSEEWGQFVVTPRNIQNWLVANGYEIIEKRYLHYRSNNKCFRFLLELEKYPIMNWSAVMFAVVARKVI